MDDILRKVEEIYEETPNWVIWLTIAIGVLTVVGTLISSLCCSTSLSLSLATTTSTSNAIKNRQEKAHTRSYAASTGIKRCR